jgi:uncharacterized protein YbjT (DUF2867 family)
MSLFAITGITGHVGGTAATRLLAQGTKVRAVVRDAAKADAWRSLGAEAAVAALDDAEALTAAFAEADGVFVMTPTWFEAENMFAENVRAVDALGQALRAVQPARTVLLSSVGAQRPHGTGAILKLHHLEQAFADLPGVVSVRAAWFMENFSGLIAHVRETGALPSMLAPLDTPQPMVATQDIGEVVAQALLGSFADRRVIELEGPRRYAPAEVAAALAEILGREVAAQILPPDAWPSAYATWGLTPHSAAAIGEMLAGFNSGWVAFEAAEANTFHGPTPLRHVLANLARS